MFNSYYLLLCEPAAARTIQRVGLTAVAESVPEPNALQ
jgi:hypothetical protein